MSCGSGTRIIQIAGGTGQDGGPYTVAPDTPVAGTYRVTDVTSGNFFDLPLGGVNLFDADDTLAAPRTHDLAGNDITFVGNGGDFVIDGKLTVTGIIDPTGIQFTDNVNQSDAAMPNTTVYVTDGTLSGIPAGELVFKDGAGNYHQLENGAGSLPITLADTTADADHYQDFAGFRQSWSNMSHFYVDAATHIGYTADDGNASAAVDIDPLAGAELKFTNAAGSEYAASVIDTGVDVAFDSDGDFRLDGDPGVAGQVFQSNGPNLPPTWEAGGDNLYTANGALTGNRTADGTGPFPGTNFGMDWNNLAKFDIDTVNAVGLGNFRLSPNGWSIEGQLGTDEGKVAFDLANQEVVLRYVDTSGGGSHQFVADGSGLGLDFDVSGDLEVNGDAGAAGEVLTSNGPGLPPTWVAGAGAVENVAVANLTADASHVHDFAGFNQDWNNLGLFTADTTVAIALQGNDGAGNTGLIDVTPGQAAIAGFTNASADGGSFSMDGQGARLFLTGAGDFRLDNDPGAAGEVFTSNGPDAAPTWEPAAGGGDNLFTADLALAADRVHDLDGHSFRLGQSGTAGQAGLFINEFGTTGYASLYADDGSVQPYGFIAANSVVRALGDALRVQSHSGGGAEGVVELHSNGSNFAGLKAPAGLAASVTWALPLADGAAGEALVTDGAGNLAWAAGSSSKYVQAIQVSDWVTVGSNWELTIPAVTHGAGTDPVVQVETGGAVVTVETLVNAAGDVTLRVPASPDLSFDGKAVIV